MPFTEIGSHTHTHAYMLTCEFSSHIIMLLTWHPQADWLAPCRASVVVITKYIKKAKTN